MQRYLLFDSACSTCSGLAEEVERESAGLLEAKSLRDPEMHQLLEQAHAPRRWEPTLIEITPGGPRVYTGINMRVRLVRGLGVRRSARMMRVVLREVVDAAATAEPDPSRRRLLKTAGIAFAGAVVGAPGFAGKALAAQPGSSPSRSAGYGIKEYSASYVGDRLEVQFVHEKRSLSGRLSILGIDQPRTVVELIRRQPVIAVELDREERAALVRADGEEAKWLFGDDGVVSQSGPVGLVATFDRDIKIASIIASELTPVPAAPTAAEGAKVEDAELAVATSSYCPCSSQQYVRGYSNPSPYWWRSDACYAATNDVAVKCSNSYCWGCCQLYACDCTCVWGDYMCVCSRRGNYCTGRCT